MVHEGVPTKNALPLRIVLLGQDRAKLKKLDLTGCDKITDAGLAHLKGLTNLDEQLRRDSGIFAKDLAIISKRLISEITLISSSSLSRPHLSDDVELTHTADHTD